MTTQRFGHPTRASLWMPVAGLDRVRWLAGPHSPLTPPRPPPSPARKPPPISAPHLAPHPQSVCMAPLSPLPATPTPPAPPLCRYFPLHPVSNVTLDFSRGFLFRRASSFPGSTSHLHGAPPPLPPAGIRKQGLRGNQAAPLCPRALLLQITGQTPYNRPLRGATAPPVPCEN